VPPFLDGLTAALYVATTLYVVANSTDEEQSVYLRTTGVALGMGLAGLHTISMAVGIDRVSRCRQLFDARVRAQAEDEDEEEEDVADQAKPAGQVPPASQPAPEPPTVTPQAAPGQ
jgi:hypothetical protein